ncbi:nuclear transport factor 2 family protein [Bizionia argentinensis JUB59]|uniref:Nuclear transport factor 2 family protein n=1 Tax=Bizionia argentinensis JUB59 TaxID=1046627 RepID=G2E9D2_9FLAO|nr:nuclear transport factor 2 family protein [Bizionia argentinensis]EGV44779.1 nuclear transport factor 2 family protein [Bizionia argentinensis JUB59]
MTSKALIKSFFESDLANDPALIEQFYHKDCLIYWNSSKGLSERNFEDISNFFEGVRESYESLRFDLTHLLKEDKIITARYTLYASTIESNADEIPIAHYISIFHLKDNKIHRAYEISQPADKDTIASEAYS